MVCWAKPIEGVLLDDDYNNQRNYDELNYDNG